MTSKLFKYLTGKLFQYFSLIIEWPVIMVFSVQTFQEFVLHFFCFFVFFSIIQSGKLDDFHEFQFAFCFILQQAPEQGLFLDSSKTNFYFLKCKKTSAEINLIFLESLKVWLGLTLCTFRVCLCKTKLISKVRTVSQVHTDIISVVGFRCWLFQHPSFNYRKVTTTNTSCLEAHLGFFRLLMMLIDAYSLFPFGKKLPNYI